MKCPYRKTVRIYPDGVSRITEVNFKECIKEECPFWGITNRIHKHRQEGGHTTYESIGCRKAEKECS